MADDFRLPVLSDDPTPEERALYIVLRLEQFIREGRTIDEGMSFRQWQAMSQVEIANHLAEVEVRRQKDDVVTKRLLFTAAAALVTIGFWGTAVSLHRIAYLTGALVMVAAGLFLMGVACEWRFRKFWKRREAKKRRTRLGRIESLNRRIKRMERELDKEASALEKELAARGR